MVRVTREGEDLLDDGFYAPSLEEERPIPNYYVDQLIAAEDVSDEIFAATDRATSDEERQEQEEDERKSARTGPGAAVAAPPIRGSGLAARACAGPAGGPYRAELPHPTLVAAGRFEPAAPPL